MPAATSRPSTRNAPPPVGRVHSLLWPSLVVLAAAVAIGLGISHLPGDAQGAGAGDAMRSAPAAPADSEAAVLLYREGNALFQQGDVLQAKALFERAVATDPGHAFSWANLGNVARDLGETEHAVRCHERAFQLTATRPRSSYNLAVSLQTAGRYHTHAHTHAHSHAYTHDHHTTTHKRNVLTETHIHAHSCLCPALPRLRARSPSRALSLARALSLPLSPSPSISLSLTHT